jgi:hypothetical protein
MICLCVRKDFHRKKTCSMKLLPGLVRITAVEQRNSVTCLFRITAVEQGAVLLAYSLDYCTKSKTEQN